MTFSNACFMEDCSWLANLQVFFLLTCLLRTLDWSLSVMLACQLCHDDRLWPTNRENTHDLGPVSVFNKMSYRTNLQNVEDAGVCVKWSYRHEIWKASRETPINFQNDLTTLSPNRVESRFVDTTPPNMQANIIINIFKKQLMVSWLGNTLTYA